MKVKNGELIRFRNMDAINYFGKVKLSKKIKVINPYAFKGCTSLTEIEIPDSVTEIYFCSFQGCKSLTKIKIPNSVTQIGFCSFQDCKSLTEIEIPNSVTKIGDGAFYGCTSLTKIKIPNSVTEIGDGAFRDCTSLTKIEIPNSVTKIGSHAFQGCTSLIEVKGLDNASEVDGDSFKGCISLKSLHLSKNLRLIYTDSFIWFYNIKLIIETSLFFIKESIYRRSKVGCLPYNTTIYGIKCNSTELIPIIQKKELEDKINEYLKNKNIVDKNGDHSKFINHVIESYKYKNYYDYRNDFEKYMEDYIKYLNKKKETESKIKSFTAKVVIKDGSDAHKSNVGQQRELIKPMNYALTELYEYANKIGLMPWVDKLRARLNISLLCGDMPKICFDDINHIYFIKEMIQSLSEDIDYDYNSAIKEYAKYYIESHNSLNKDNIDNKKKVSLDKKPLTLRKK